MKFCMYLMTALLALTLCGEAMVDYDFTGEAIKTGGKCPPLKFSGVTAGGTAGKRFMIFDGKSSTGSIPASEKIHLMDGGTVITRVKFDDKGDGKNYHMLLLKDKEWWLARNGENLHFNFAESGKAARGISVKVPFDKPITIGLSVSANDQYVLYVDGKKMSAGILSVRSAPDKTAKGITVGDGWGGSWKFKGELYKLAVYNEVLAEAELAKQTGEQ